MSKHPGLGGSTPGRERREAMRKKLVEGVASGERVVLDEHKEPWKPNGLQSAIIAIIVCALASLFIFSVYQNSGNNVKLDDGHEQVVSLLSSYDGPEKADFSMFVEARTSGGITKGELKEIKRFHKTHTSPE